MGRGAVRRAMIVAVAAGAAAVGVVAAPAAGASGRTQILIQDRCDPVTFTAAGVPCVPTPHGEVTFQELVATLTPEVGGHGAWNFSREATHIDRGDTLRATNTGGETHSFTEVLSFGATPIPDFAVLNQALPAGTPFAVPAEDPGATFRGPGGVRTLTGLTPGRHRFQCFIHPWMRTTVEVRG